MRAKIRNLSDNLISFMSLSADFWPHSARAVLRLDQLVERHFIKIPYSTPAVFLVRNVARNYSSTRACQCCYYVRIEERHPRYLLESLIQYLMLLSYIHLVS